MKQYEVVLESISPLLMHGSQAIGLSDNSKKKGGEAIKGDSEEWKKTVYFSSDVGAFIPAVNVEAAMIEASKQFKVGGRATATKFVKSGVFITQDQLQLLVNDKPIKELSDIKVDVRTVKNPATKMRNTRYRAVFDKWNTSFFIVLPLYRSLITPEVILKSAAVDLGEATHSLGMPPCICYSIRWYHSLWSHNAELSRYSRACTSAEWLGILSVWLWLVVVLGRL